MVRSLLIRGMLVGAGAGFLAFLFAHQFGEPQVQHAIDFETYLAKLHHEPEGAEIVSRGVQRTWGLAIGCLAMGTALGGIFALTFAYAYGRIGALGARATSALLAVLTYVTVVVVPFTKYPANPPTIGNPATIDKRTILYVVMISISVLAAVAAGRIRRETIASRGAWNASILAGVAFVAVIAIAQVALPVVHETPNGFPADVLYRFRLASLGISATIWLTIGLGFGAAAERLLAPRAEKVRAPGAVPA